MAEKKEEPTSAIHYVQRVLKGDTYMVLASSQFEPEDEFKGYTAGVKDSSKAVLEPPFPLKVLAGLSSVNNILSQCIEAMVVNIDGTGHELISVEDGKDHDKTEEKNLLSFLNEPYPGKSLISIRTDIRNDSENSGTGYMEVLRNAEGDLMGLRHMPATGVRMVRLDAPLDVEKTVSRNGKDVKIKVQERERRFVQSAGSNRYIYYREFGVSRHLHRDTGEWESEENPLDPNVRATELLAFRVKKDLNSPYGLPRWINQLPSVLGSRKAEEENLSFLDAGGMPPAIIFIQGGTLAKDVANDLRMYLSGQAKNKYRAAIVEAQSSGGSIDKDAGVKITVERFGAEKANDAMFANYDKSTEDHVRVGFRLPPLFIGRSEDYNFASAKTSYMVAEAQVFGPERTEFDEIFNRTVMKALGAKTCKFKSKPITLKDVETQMKGLELSKDVTTKESFIKEMNTITGLVLEENKDAPQPGMPVPGAAPGVPGAPGVPKPKAAPVVAPKAKTAGSIAPEKPAKKVQKMAALAQEWGRAEGLIPSKFDFSEADRETIRKQVDELSVDDKAFVTTLLINHANAPETETE